MTPEPDKDELEQQLADERAQRAKDAQTDDEQTDDEQTDDAAADDELEDDAADDELEDDDEPEAVAVQELSDTRRAKLLGKLVDGFEGELRELFGESEPLTPVPMDGALGFMVPGMLELVPNDKYRRCSTCNGHGQVLTGSLADGKQTADCPRCAGLGFLTRLEGEQEQTGETTNGNAAVDPDAGFGVEKWMGDPNIGASR